MDIKIQKENLAPLTDLSLIGYLALSFPILKIDSSNLNKTVFFFEDTPALQKQINSFWNNTATVHPLEYFNSLKNLKTRIHSRN